MKVIIPMAGYGTRLRPHTYSRPKPLINIAGQPMLKHLLDSLQKVNIDEYIFIVGYLGDQLEEYIRETYDFQAVFLRQDDLTGQSPAIYLARDHLQGPTIVLFADTLFEADLDVINHTEADAVTFVKTVDDPRRFGVVEVSSQGRVTRFIEKPDSMENKNALIGLHYIKDAELMLRAIEQQVGEMRMTKGEFYIADAFQIMIDSGADFRIQNVSIWLDTGKPETVLETNRYLLEHGSDNSGDIQLDGVMIIPPVNIHRDAHLKHCIIGPYTTIAADCDISYSIIRDSIVDSGAEVSKSMLDQSLIGRYARVIGRYRTLNVGDESSIGFN